MAIGPRLDLRQSQSLVMTPQLQQAIRLLALSNVEIEAAIAEEVERNPLLEVAGEELPETADTPGEERAEAADAFLEQSDAGDEAALDVDLTAETFHHDSVSDSGSGTASEDGPDFDSFAAEAPSLHDHLLAQAGTALAPPDLVIAAQLIDQIDECGYLQGQPLEIAGRLGVPLFRVEAVIVTIQGFEPTGVGARTLGECLALQAREADRYDPAMACLLDNLELLALGRVAQLQRICGVDAEDIADMVRELRNYDPKPGLRYGSSRIESVTPDLFVIERGKGWAVEINSATLPRLLVNREYLSATSGRGDKASKEWLSDCLASANWLVRALDQRQRTIVRVAEAIVRNQEAFFRSGVAYLKPMILRQVADEIGMHESTVSRVTSNKFLSCRRGTFEFKYFFTTAIAASDGGDAVSAEAVKSRIRALIVAERPDAILSDDTLVEMLKASGFDIARRTVAKYREAMGIGSSVQRRRQKAIEARAAA